MKSPDVLEAIICLAGDLVIYDARGSKVIRRIPHVPLLPFIRRRINIILEYTAVTTAQIEDEDDACPDVPEDMDGWEDEDGCPEFDNDGDGFLDPDDGCPNEAENINGVEDDDGCPDEDPPADRDGDGILDDVDRCPNEPELVNGYLDEDGCPDVKPQKVRITKKRIIIEDKIQFEVDSARIKSVSHEILDAVAQVLQDYPQIRVRIEGHTDSDGSDSYNMRLSNRRAGSVLDYLTDATKIDRTRLESIGFGETRPLDTNRTDEGKGANRRVEFHIVEGMD